MVVEHVQTTDYRVRTEYVQRPILFSLPSHESSASFQKAAGARGSRRGKAGCWLLVAAALDLRKMPEGSADSVQAERGVQGPRRG